MSKTIEKITWTSRPALEEMIRCCLGKIKNPTSCQSNIKNSISEKNFFGGQESSKKKN